MKRWVRRQTASPNQTIREVIKIISNAQIGVALVVDAQDKLLGYVTDSDIRRAILKDISFDSPVSEIMVKNPITLSEGLSIDEMLNVLKQKRVHRAPIVDAEGTVKDIALYWRLQDKKVKQKGHHEDDRDESHIDFTIEAPKENRKNKKVLVIGAGGYVGSVVCRELLEEGYEVRGIDRFLFGDESLQDIISHSNFEMVKGDILSLDVLINNIFGIDAVINLAAIVGDPACDLDVNHTIMVNYFSAKVAADIARHYKIERYLFASTCAVYGASKGKEMITEGSPVAPVSLYAETKLKSEQGILSLADLDFSPCIFRLSTVFGLSPRMRFDLVVNLLALHALTQKKITVFGGEQWRPYVHVRDLARALVLGLKADRSTIHGEIFNLGSNEQNLRVIDLARKVAEIIPGTEIIHNRDMQDQRDYYVSFDKIREKLGFEPKWNIESAIAEIRDAYQQGQFRDFQDKKYNNMRQQEHLIFG